MRRPGRSRNGEAGGLPLVAAFLARNLPAHGIATEVLDVRDENPHLSPVGEALRAAGIPVRLTVTTSAKLWDEGWRPGVVSAHGVMPWDVIAAVRRQGVPWVETLHGLHDYMEGGATWRQEAGRAKGISAIVAVSQEVRSAYLAGNASYPADRAVTIPNGLHPHGFDLRESLPCADRIHIKGHLNNRWALLAAADAVVLNSFFEGWPLVPMEALSSGLPVVMSAVAGAMGQVGGDPLAWVRGTQPGRRPTGGHLGRHPGGPVRAAGQPGTAGGRDGSRCRRTQAVCRDPGSAGG